MHRDGVVFEGINELGHAVFILSAVAHNLVTCGKGAETVIQPFGSDGKGFGIFAFGEADSDVVVMDIAANNNTFEVKVALFLYSRPYRILIKRLAQRVNFGNVIAKFLVFFIANVIEFQQHDFQRVVIYLKHGIAKGNVAPVFG